MLQQINSLEDGLVFAGRILIFVVYLVLFLFFRKNYMKSKVDGLPNKFSLGYAFFFGALFFFGLMSVINDVLNIFVPGSGFIGNLDTDFSTLYGITPGYELILPKLANPLYLVGILVLMILLATQVYPLEVVLNWKKLPGTKYLIIIAAAILG